MKTYTVIGVYESDGESFAREVQADNEHDAMAIAAGHANGDPELCIVGAIEGAHTLYSACESSHSSAYASDLLEELYAEYQRQMAQTCMDEIQR